MFSALDFHRNGEAWESPAQVAQFLQVSAPGVFTCLGLRSSGLHASSHLVALQHSLKHVKMYSPMSSYFDPRDRTVRLKRHMPIVIVTVSVSNWTRCLRANDNPNAVLYTLQRRGYSTQASTARKICRKEQSRSFSSFENRLFAQKHPDRPSSVQKDPSRMALSESGLRS